MIILPILFSRQRLSLVAVVQPFEEVLSSRMIMLLILLVATISSMEK
jgi:hypothetical protein